MVRMEMIGVDENDNKPELEDASHDYVDDFNIYILYPNVIIYTDLNI